MLPHTSLYWTKVRKLRQWGHLAHFAWGWNSTWHTLCNFIKCVLIYHSFKGFHCQKGPTGDVWCYFKILSFHLRLLNRNNLIFLVLLFLPLLCFKILLVCIIYYPLHDLSWEISSWGRYGLCFKILKNRLISCIWKLECKSIVQLKIQLLPDALLANSNASSQQYRSIVDANLLPQA